MSPSVFQLNHKAKQLLYSFGKIERERGISKELLFPLNSGVPKNFLTSMLKPGCRDWSHPHRYPSGGFMKEGMRLGRPQSHLCHWLIILSERRHEWPKSREKEIQSFGLKIKRQKINSN